MKHEALKLALEAITTYLSECPDPSEEAVEGLCDAASVARRALAAPVQEPVAWMDVDEKGAISGLRYWSEPDNRHEVALYTTPPQRTEERNFCPRCGKRTGDLTSIHTCTPPQD
jgi:hypothetical protein